MGIGKPVLDDHSRPNMRSDGWFYIKLWEMAGAAGFEPATYGFGVLNKAIHKLHRVQIFLILLGFPKRIVVMVLMITYSF